VIVWPTGVVRWPCKVGWLALTTKSATAAVFTCKFSLTNKTRRQKRLTLSYFLVQYHFALHPPFKQSKWWLLKRKINGWESEVYLLSETLLNFSIFKT
jgi:hypothetical protein